MKKTGKYKTYYWDRKPWQDKLKSMTVVEPTITECGYYMNIYKNNDGSGYYFNMSNDHLPFWLCYEFQTEQECRDVMSLTTAGIEEQEKEGKE